uniref:IMD domain-containing protein n=1 Tax=Cyprinodon variegatus TaxID=28743 RepID=A0A3Q2DXZ6_CYPVA
MESAHVSLSPGILDQFNPSLKNFVTMGKHYEKALTGVTVAAKGYFDALVKLGELASDSQGSKELGDTLFQMAEVHRQIQVQLEDVVRLSSTCWFQSIYTHFIVYILLNTIKCEGNKVLMCQYVKLSPRHLFLWFSRLVKVLFYFNS